MLVAAKCVTNTGGSMISSSVYLHKEFPNRDPQGWLDNVSQTGIWGWSCDYNDYSMPVKIHLYADGTPGAGTFLGEILANSEREAAVGQQCAGITAHGFSTTVAQLPDNARAYLMDGRSHQIYAYAINYPQGNNPQLAGSPKTLAAYPVPTTAQANNESQLASALTALSVALNAIKALIGQ
jgi:hypothetical protein